MFWVHLGSVWFCCAQLGSVGLCWVQLGSVGFSWVFLGRRPCQLSARPPQYEGALLAASGPRTDSLPRHTGGRGRGLGARARCCSRAEQQNNIHCAPSVPSCLFVQWVVGRMVGAGAPYSSALLVAVLGLTGGWRLALD